MKKIYLIRHGETEWTLSDQHTGTSDIALTENGKKQAQALAKRLNSELFQKVFVSPMIRTRQTCQIAGFSQQAIVDSNLVEWNYGKYEGLTSKEIHQKSPHWNVFLNGAPSGENVENIKLRTTQLLQAFQKIQGNIAVFSHGHFLRALAVAYIEQPIQMGRHFSLFPAAISILSYEKSIPAICLWNDISHMM